MVDHLEDADRPAVEPAPALTGAGPAQDLAVVDPTSALAPANRSVLPVPEAERRGRAPLWFLLVLTALSVGADLWSKAWAMGYFEGIKRGDPRQLVLVDGYLSFIYAKNRGGAWGLLQNENESLRRPFFLIVSVVAIVFIVTLYRRLAPGQTALKWGLPLVLGGALGNLVDRVRYGFVVDFIDAYAAWGGEVKHWPTFNVADVAICIGVGLMAIDMFTPRRTRHASLLSSSAVEPLEPAAPADPLSRPAPAAVDAATSVPERSAGPP